MPPRRASADGRYRVRVCASAVNTGGKPLPMMCVYRVDQYAREAPTCAVWMSRPERSRDRGGSRKLMTRRLVLGLPGGDNHKAESSSPSGAARPGRALGRSGPPWPPAGYIAFRRRAAGRSRSPAEAEGRKARPNPPTAPTTGGSTTRCPGSRPRRPNAVAIVPAQPSGDPSARARALLHEAIRGPRQGCLIRQAMVVGYQAALCSPHFLFL